MTDENTTRTALQNQKKSNNGATKPMNKLRPTKQPPTLIEMYDELSEVIALNYFFYDAMEALYKEADQSQHHETSHMGLLLFTRYLREREQLLKDHLHLMKLVDMD